MTPKRRAEVFAVALELKHSGTIAFSVASRPASFIDAHGITAAIRDALETALLAVARPDGAEVFLDGQLFAPREFAQKTIIHGDAVVPVISLASVIAKVTRDQDMERLGHEYPEYGFAVHKGYGTALHREKIIRCGPSPIHRMSFLKRIVAEGAGMVPSNPWQMNRRRKETRRIPR